jgi:hypothetical protein
VIDADSWAVKGEMDLAYRVGGLSFPGHVHTRASTWRLRSTWQLASNCDRQADVTACEVGSRPIPSGPDA